jgi:hypothetical protein
MTHAWAATIMAEAHNAQVERMAQERVVLLGTAHGEVDKVAKRVFFLESDLMAKEKLQSLATMATAANR